MALKVEEIVNHSSVPEKTIIVIIFCTCTKQASKQLSNIVMNAIKQSLKVQLIIMIQ